MTEPARSLSDASSEQVATPYVLVVDDDADIRTVIRMTLEEDGYRVVAASNGQQALDRIVEMQPAVVLLDLTMPVMNGWELNGRLKEMGLAVPVVFMTAAFRARAEAEMHGAAGHLTKPFDLEDLVHTVERFVNGS